MPLSKEQEQRLSSLAAPEGTIPGVAAIECVIAQNRQTAVYVTSVAGYPFGFEINLMIVCSADNTASDSFLLGSAEWLQKTQGGDHEQGGEPEGSPEVFRFGLRFADGTMVSNAELGRGLSNRGGDGRPTAGRMRLLDGHGSDGKYEIRYWVCPIPPVGQLVLECEWPAASLERTQVEIDAKAIRDASARARAIFAKRAAGF
jgi:hypothetical protein